MESANLGHISRLLERKYGRDIGRQMFQEAICHQRLSGQDLRDIVVAMSDGRLTRAGQVEKTVKKQIKRFAKMTKNKGYRMENGVRIYQGGAPGLIQQRSA